MHSLFSPTSTNSLYLCVDIHLLVLPKKEIKKLHINTNSNIQMELEQKKNLRLKANYRGIESKRVEIKSKLK